MLPAVVNLVWEPNISRHQKAEIQLKAAGYGTSHTKKISGSYLSLVILVGRIHSSMVDLFNSGFAPSRFDLRLQLNTECLSSYFSAQFQLMADEERASFEVDRSQTFQRTVMRGGEKVL